MRLLHYSQPDGPVRVAAERPDGSVMDLARAADEAGEPFGPKTIDDVLQQGLLSDVAALVARATPLSVVDISRARIHAPLLHPRKIIGVGLNYADHAAEVGAPVPPEPVFFAKFNNSVIGPFDPIVLPHVSDQVDWEAELVVVIGRVGRDIPELDSMNYVAGYTVGNDISARDWQSGKPMRQWILGKTFDTFLPLGPVFVSADEVGDPHQLRVTCEVTGQLMQSAITNLHFRVPALISYVSQVLTLEPGDILLTGTPAGVGMNQSPPRFLRDGDTVVTAIEGLGRMSNPVVARA